MRLLTLSILLLTTLGLVKANAFVPSKDGLYAVFDFTIEKSAQNPELEDFHGEVVMNLFIEQSPTTVANFISLAEGTRPYFDTVTHEVYYGDMIDPETGERFLNPLTGAEYHEIGDPILDDEGEPVLDTDDNPTYYEKRTLVLDENDDPIIDPDVPLDPYDIVPFYDGYTFHRLVTNWILQGGSSSGTGSSNVGYSIPDEMHPALNFYPHVIAMANSGTNTGDSQFFITLEPTPDWGDEPFGDLQGKHTIFGIIEDDAEHTGRNALIEINKTPPVSAGSDTPYYTLRINSVTIVREGSAAEAFDPADYNLPIPIKHSSDEFDIRYEPIIVTIADPDAPDDDPDATIDVERTWVWLANDPHSDLYAQISNNLSVWINGDTTKHTGYDAKEIHNYSLYFSNSKRLYFRNLFEVDYADFPDLEDTTVKYSGATADDLVKVDIIINLETTLSDTGLVVTKGDATVTYIDEPDTDPQEFDITQYQLYSTGGGRQQLFIEFLDGQSWQLYFEEGATSGESMLRTATSNIFGTIEIAPGI